MTKPGFLFVSLLLHPSAGRRKNKKTELSHALHPNVICSWVGLGFRSDSTRSEGKRPWSISHYGACVCVCGRVQNSCPYGDDIVFVSGVLPFRAAHLGSRPLWSGVKWSVILSQVFLEAAFLLDVILAHPCWSNFQLDVLFLFS